MLATYQSGLEVVDAWISGINSGNLDRVLDLYAEEAILLPTFSTQVRRGKIAISQYFLELVEDPDLAVNLHDKSVRCHAMDEVHEIVCGLYRFTRQVDGIFLNFEARFTFVCNLNIPNPIVHHHSSQVPRGI